LSRAAALRLWWAHLRTPLAAFVLLASIFATTRFDIAIARATFFDASALRWVGAGSWWVNAFLHTGGRWLIRAIVAGAAALLAASRINRDLRALRRPAAYFVLATVVSIGLVGALKVLTNVDCPWDLREFGGRFPFVELLAHRPRGLRAARCFPAAHAGSGYALLALYFVFRERHARLARLGLAAGVVTGLLFGIAQQSRGAHFASHDLWSAFLVWLTSLSVYAFAFRAQLWTPLEQYQAVFAFHETSPASGALAADGVVAVERSASAVQRPPGQ
jgi:membrane-associated PAP2 superfamily phosphatase